MDKVETLETLVQVILERSEGNRDVTMLLIKICKELPLDDVVDFFSRLEIYEISAFQIWLRYHLSWLPNGEQKDRDFPSESRQQCDKDMYKLVSSYKE